MRGATHPEEVAFLFFSLTFTEHLPRARYNSLPSWSSYSCRSVNL